MNPLAMERTINEIKGWNQRTVDRATYRWPCCGTEFRG
jgi:hypothetical protein